MATIQLVRDSGYADRLRAYKVVLDEKEIGEIRDGENKTFSIAPGQHELRCTIDWAGSNTIRFALAENEVAVFSVTSSLRGLRIFLSLWYALIARNSYLCLKEES